MIIKPSDSPRGAARSSGPADSAGGGSLAGGLTSANDKEWEKALGESADSALLRRPSVSIRTRITLAFALIFVFADLRELWRTLADADARLLPLPFLCGISSYLLMAWSYQGIVRAAGAELSFAEMFKITLVANTANYLVATGGLSGLAVRMYFLTNRGVASGTAVVISLIQTFLTNVTLLFFLLTGMIILFSQHTLHGYALAATTALLVIFSIAGILATLLLFHARVRRRTLFALAQTTHWVMHRLIPHRTPPRTHIWRYQSRLNRGIEFLMSRKRQMLGPFVLIIVDWIVTLLIIQTAFAAVRYPVRPSFVIIGFAVGIVLSFVSFIPGGLGIMEGSMAGIYASLGVPFETALVAVLVFRCAYYLLPMLTSLFFFHGMFVQAREIRTERPD